MYGIPYYEQKNTHTLTQHIQSHAWFEGGAPSLRIWPIEFDPIEGVTLNRSACYFSVLESEYRFCQSHIPSLSNPERPLRFEEWTSGKTVCTGCWKIGHTAGICQQRKQHPHPACSRCGSFAHRVSECQAPTPNACCAKQQNTLHAVVPCSVVSTVRQVRFP